MIPKTILWSTKDPIVSLNAHEKVILRPFSGRPFRLYDGHNKFQGGDVNSLIEAISDFISSVVAITLVSGGLILVAGEFRLAALKKASHGSTRLSGFTQRMTKTKLHLEE